MKHLYTKIRNKIKINITYEQGNIEFLLKSIIRLSSDYFPAQNNSIIRVNKLGQLPIGKLCRCCVDNVLLLCNDWLHNWLEMHVTDNEKHRKVN